MPTIDHRRHAMRTTPGQHLSRTGVDLARRVGAGEFGSVPRYDLVVTSTVPRAYGTAIAMGFAVDEQLEVLPTMDEAALDELHRPLHIGEAARVLLGDGPARHFARSQAEVLRGIARGLPADGTALVVSHGSIVEAGAITLLPDADHQAWGPAIGYVEGIRLFFDGDTCVRAELLRVGEDDYLLLNSFPPQPRA
jgi:broad specificity phosphatase PhoE